MMIQCTHGYFKFKETRAGQLSKLVSLFGFDISGVEDYFTFAGLVDAPDYSIKGGRFLGCPTTETFEGEPWQVMRANGLVYDFVKKKVVPIESIIQSVSIRSAGNFYISDGIILPGSITDDGSRVTDYAAHYESGRFNYSEVVVE